MVTDNHRPECQEPAAAAVQRHINETAHMYAALRLAQAHAIDMTCTPLPPDLPAPLDEGQEQPSNLLLPPPRWIPAGPPTTDSAITYPEIVNGDLVRIWRFPGNGTGPGWEDATIASTIVSGTFHAELTTGHRVRFVLARHLRLRSRTVSLSPPPASPDPPLPPSGQGPQHDPPAPDDPEPPAPSGSGSEGPPAGNHSSASPPPLPPPGLSPAAGRLCPG
jgi:hypothetical protein